MQIADKRKINEKFINKMILNFDEDKKTFNIIK